MEHETDYTSGSLPLILVLSKVADNALNVRTARFIDYS